MMTTRPARRGGRRPILLVLGPYMQQRRASDSRLNARCVFPLFRRLWRYRTSSHSPRTRLKPHARIVPASVCPQPSIVYKLMIEMTGDRWNGPGDITRPPGAFDQTGWTAAGPRVAGPTANRFSKPLRRPRSTKHRSSARSPSAPCSISLARKRSSLIGSSWSSTPGGYGPGSTGYQREAPD